MKQLLTLVLFLAAVCSSEARTIRDFFASEPDDILLLVPQTARLDLLDYYDSGQKVEMNNRLGNGTQLVSVDSTFLKIRTSHSRTVEMLMLQYSKRDTILAVIETVLTPVPDSRLRFFNSNWVELSSIKPLKKMPTLDDFFLTTVSKDKRKELTGRLPFTLLEMSFTGDRHDTLTVKHGLKEFLTKEEYALFQPYVRPVITYSIQGAKFKRQ